MGRNYVLTNTFKLENNIRLYLMRSSQAEIMGKIRFLLIAVAFSFGLVACEKDNKAVVEKYPVLLTDSTASYNNIPVTEFQKGFLDRINQIRKSGCNCGTDVMPPVAPLAWNSKLELAAALHAKDMAENNYFSHTSLDGRSLLNRINATGYTMENYQTFSSGENIAWNQKTIDEVMKGWINSPGHCLNLMNKSFKEVGVAVNNWYWVQDFGGRTPL